MTIEQLPGSDALVVDGPTTEHPQDDIPDDVVDRLLWRDAQYVLRRHRPGGRGCACCGAAWPCTPWRLARRAQAAAALPTGDLTGGNPSGGDLARADGPRPDVAGPGSARPAPALPERRGTGRRTRRPRPAGVHVGLRA